MTPPPAPTRPAQARPAAQAEPARIGSPAPGSAEGVAVPAPIALLAELTHRCPLSCAYCSNPLELVRAGEELATETWIDVFRQAAALGVLHLHLSGGEPASRRDLVALTRGAADAGLYTNLITSGVGIDEARLAALVEAGLDHVQLSLQGTNSVMTGRIAGLAGAFDRKLRFAAQVKGAGLPLTVNAVCHRVNMDTLPEMVDLALQLGAGRIEIATVQFHGWASLNVAQLLPTRQQAELAAAFVTEARLRLAGRLVIDFVPADYHARYPKACMGGWGRVGLNVTPSGKVLPCHAAETIPGLDFDNVRDKPLGEIWYGGRAFAAYRGDAWMKEPCSRCSRKHVDFGGCRCQALALAGDARATDPVCHLSPDRHRLEDFVARSLAAPAGEIVYRSPHRTAPA